MLHIKLLINQHDQRTGVLCAGPNKRPLVPNVQFCLEKKKTFIAHRAVERLTGLHVLVTYASPSKHQQQHLDPSPLSERGDGTRGSKSERNNSVFCIKKS